MLKGIIEFSLTRRTLVLVALLAFLGAGALAFSRLNIEAYPDPAPPMVEVITQSPGQSAEEIERYITIPIEVAMAGMPGLQYVRSISLYGLSDVKLQFSYDTNYNSALQQTLNRLNTLTLPNNVQPTISPWSAVGEIYRYQLVGPPGYSLTDLKTLQNWVLQRRFKTIPGVIDVVGWGGLSKEYHVEVDLPKLVAYNVTLSQVLTAITNSNLNVGARTLDLGEQAVNVRGLGLISSLEDINNIVLTQSKGTPVLLKDVAKVEVGAMPRLGIAGRDQSSDVVLGTVLMRRGEKTLDVLKRVQAEVAKINKGGVLPPGVRLETYYDRGDLIHVTTHTVLHNVVFGVVLVFLIQWLFLGGLRSALIVAATIPFALFFSVILIVLRGDSANLLSVGAIDFGIIVDSTVILVENVFRHLQERGSPPSTHRAANGRPLTILLGAVEVSTAIFFAAAIMVAAFLPLFTMQGVEGQIFAPMAKTYGYALSGALLATFTVSPMLASFLLPATVQEKETLFVRGIRAVYVLLLRRALRYRVITVAIGIALVAVTVSIVPHLGSEFLPKLEEGNLWIRAALPATIGLQAGESYVARIRDILRSFPEVITVTSQHGRPDDGTDPTGFFNAEFFAPLKPFEQWPPGLTKEKLMAAIQEKLRQELVGIEFNFSQYIEDNVEEAVSGIKGENAIKIFGPDLRVLQEKAQAIKARIATVPGVEDAGTFTALGQPNLMINVDRARSARYGILPGDVNAVVQAAIGGQAVTDIFEGERRFPLVVRFQPQYRQSVEAIKNIQVAVPSGGPQGGNVYVPLSELASITIQPGASYIYRENNERYLPVKFSVRGRDLGSTVTEAQAKVAERVQLPAGYRLEWSGEFGELEEAQQRLAVIVPVSILLILGLLYSMFNSWRDSLLALTFIPSAVCGGILALYLTGTNFSVSASVGFISLFGVSVLHGILMLTFYHHLHAAGHERQDALRRAAETRMRPMLMTALSACVGLLPAAMSTGIGSQVQRPLATVVVGGMFLASVLNLLVMPAFWSFVLPTRRQDSRHGRVPLEVAAVSDDGHANSFP